MEKKDDILIQRKAIAEIASQRDMQDQQEMVDLVSKFYGTKNQSNRRLSMVGAYLDIQDLALL